MSRYKRIPRLALGFVLAAATLSAAFSLPKAPDAFTPFVPQTPPQLALGDFDGDGRVDSALIQDGAGEHRISVQLSGSPSAVHLEARVSGVIEGDIDHDGDLDLVASTPDGDVLIWLNDGHGRFSRQTASRTRGLSSGPVVIQTVWPESMAIGIGAPVLPSPTRETAVMVTRIRTPTAEVVRDVRCQILPALRAPPASFA
jgi:hypothetical protein